MPVPQLRRYTQIYADMVNRIVARTELTDITRSGFMGRVVGAAARQLDAAYFELAKLRTTFSILDATGTDLIARGRDYPLTPPPAPAQRAAGMVVISRLTNPGTTRQLPAGVRVLGPTGSVYRTTRATQVLSTSPEQVPGHGVGRDFEPVPIVAVTPGAAGNADIGTITQFESTPSGANEVTNLSAITGGLDQESDDSYRARIINWQASLANSQPFAIETLLRGVRDSLGRVLRFATVYADPTQPGRASVYIDDGVGLSADFDLITGEVMTAALVGPPAGSAAGGEEFLSLAQAPVRQISAFTLTSSLRGALVLGTHYTYDPEVGRVRFDPPLAATEVITADYGAWNGLIREAQRRVTGVSSDRANYPGWRAAGTSILVLPARVQFVAIYGIVDTTARADRATVLAAAEAEAIAYVNGLAPGESFIRQRLEARVMNLPGVRDLSLPTPAANINPSFDTVLRTSASFVDFD